MQKLTNSKNSVTKGMDQRLSSDRMSLSSGSAMIKTQSGSSGSSQLMAQTDSDYGSSQNQSSAVASGTVSEGFSLGSYLQGFIDRNILPLYQTVGKARSVWAFVHDPKCHDAVYETAEMKASNPIESYNFVASISSANKMFVKQKALEVEVLRDKAYNMENKASAFLIKRYMACDFAHYKDPNFKIKKNISKAANIVCENEVRIMRVANGSPYVHTLYEVLVSDEEVKKEIRFETWLKFDWADLGSLGDILAFVKKNQATDETKDYKGLMTTQQVSAITCQILKGMIFLHQHKIVHGNLSSDNIVMWPPGVARIANFECAFNLDEASERHPDSDLVGVKLRHLLNFDANPKAIYYAPPEKILFTQYLALDPKNPNALSNDSAISLAKDVFNQSTDVYALGVLMLEMILHTPPMMNATEEEQFTNKRGETVSRDIDRSRQKFMDFMTGLRGRANADKCGSALHHLFYPHYEVVKHIMDREGKMDIDYFKDNLPELHKTPTDSLVILMGFKDEKERYAEPDPMNPKRIPRFEQLFSISCYFDFVRQCLFLPNEMRPTAEMMSQHLFVKKAFDELDGIDEYFDGMIEQMKTRAGRHQFEKSRGGKGFKTGLTVMQVYDWLKANRYRPSV